MGVGHISVDRDKFLIVDINITFMTLDA